MTADWQLAAKLYNKYAPTAGDDTFSNAVLQVAIWKALFPSATITEVNAPGVISAADGYLTSGLSSVSDQATYFNMGGGNQSMIGGYRAVPEPASLAALGLGSLVLLKRRRKA